ncbi:MAG TPA: TIGR03435 family protein [Acidobacteriaceae bacterium]|nr:TIGR03435 family protein [Acidobacteriaceae bacterium]
MVRFAVVAVVSLAGMVPGFASSQVPSGSVPGLGAVGSAVATASVSSSSADPKAEIVFDVVSVKPVEEKHNGHMSDPANGDGILITNSTLNEIVRWSYKLGNGWRAEQFHGAPKWFTIDNFDIHAKVADADMPAWLKLSDVDRRIIFRKALSDRFGLTVHFQDVDMPVFYLVIAKGGLKIKEAKPGELSPYHFHQMGDPNTPLTGRGLTMRPVGPGGRWITVTQLQTMATFCKDLLNDEVGRYVIDKTGLTGAYNFTLDYAPESMLANARSDGQSSDPAAPSIFTALPEQLGVKLESGRGPVPVMFIDSVHQPTAD